MAPARHCGCRVPPAPMYTFWQGSPCTKENFTSRGLLPAGYSLTTVAGGNGWVADPLISFCGSGQVSVGSRVCTLTFDPRGVPAIASASLMCAGRRGAVQGRLPCKGLSGGGTRLRLGALPPSDGSVRQLAVTRARRRPESSTNVVKTI